MADSQPNSLAGEALPVPAAQRRPFRFGAKAQHASSGKDWSGTCRRIEDLGYCSVQVPDHLSGQLGAVPAMMAAADATTTLTVGPLVAAVDFRNPAIFAREAATIDLLSDGRFIMGIGAGWNADDYAAAGIVQHDAATRIDRLDEAVQIMRGLWEPGRFRFDGDHFRVGETDGTPKPARRIPMLIGGGGRKVLTLAARHADIISINPIVINRRFDSHSLRTATADLVDERMRWIAEAAGPRFADIDFQMHVFAAVITGDRERAAGQIAERFGIAVGDVLSGPYFQVGPMAQIVDNMHAMRERWGISYVAFQPEATEVMAPVVAALAGT